MICNAADPRYLLRGTGTMRWERAHPHTRECQRGRARSEYRRCRWESHASWTNSSLATLCLPSSGNARPTVDSWIAAFPGEGRSANEPAPSLPPFPDDKLPSLSSAAGRLRSSTSLSSIWRTGGANSPPVFPFWGHRCEQDLDAGRAPCPRLTADQTSPRLPAQTHFN
jgi:hypothetical protein